MKNITWSTVVAVFLGSILGVGLGHYIFDVKQKEPTTFMPITMFEAKNEQPIGDYYHHLVSDGILYMDQWIWTPFTTSQVVDKYNGSMKLKRECDPYVAYGGFPKEAPCGSDWIDAKYIFLYKDYIGEMRSRDRDAMERKIRGQK